MKKYLPLGSVVTLKNAQKKIMIIGRYQVSDDVLYDYSGVLFPEGYLKQNQLYVFNNEDVDAIYYMGMQNEEEFTFRKKLAEINEQKEKEDNKEE